jgi:hypothetical protein
MKHRFLLHSLNHAIMVVDVSEVGVEGEANLRTRNTKMVPVLRFMNWNEAVGYFRAKLADENTLEKTRSALHKRGVAVMTVV